MQQNQISNHTEYNRTPKIFEEASSNFKKPKVLSFGCSFGKEVDTLNSLYFQGSIIHGLDIDKEIISSNNSKNTIKNIKYFDDLKNIDRDYDVIFCMSVLCRWPDNQDKYSFETYNHTLTLLDRHLNPGGIIVIYNSQYLFRDSDISLRYVPINNESLDSGFVKRWTSDYSFHIKQNQPVIFKKITNTKIPTTPFAVLWASTTNLGDDIQTLAGINFLRKKFIEPTQFINREELSDYSGPNVNLIMNGWFTHNIHKFRPNKNINPIFLSFHCANEKIIQSNIDYFLQHEPIGCRDLHTLSLFRKHNIKSYFTGCLTLYFNQENIKSNFKYIVDVNDCNYIPKVNFDNSKFSDYIKISHEIEDKKLIFDLPARLKIAKNIIVKYKHADHVITSRLHSALPCRAFGTSVSFLHSNLGDDRFTGLTSILAGSNSILNCEADISRELLKPIIDQFDSIKLSNS